MHSFFDELDILDQAQQDAEQEAEAMGFESDVDRRKFVFLSLTAAAATTFGFGSKALAQARGGGVADTTAAGGGRGTGRGGGSPPPPLDQMENLSWTFQPYPGGTGALFEKTLREKGGAAFDRQRFVWTPTAGAFYIAPWGTAPLPATDEEIAFLPAHRLAAAIQARRLTPTRITRIYLDRLKRFNPTLQFAVTIMEEQALAEAARADAEIAAGRYLGPLHGLPWGVKDLFAAKGTPATWGAKDFANQVHDYDSEVIVRLRQAGAILVAKLSTGQFAQGATWWDGERTTRNPWNTSQGSSGSSAGPASATAAGCVAFALGTETNGSILSPAAACGVAALRPTFGRVSRHGGMVLGWSQDRVGPMTRTIQDSAMVFNAIHGADEKDPGSITMPFHFNHDINFANIRIGLRQPGGQGYPAEFTEFLGKIRELGARPTDLGPPPSVPGAGGSFNPESAAAFDFYVQFKARELGVDVATLMEMNSGRGGGRGGAADSTAGRGGRGGTTRPPGVNDGQLNRWLGGRNVTAFQFLQEQRYRLKQITAWQEYLKDIDLYIGASGETSVHARTGHPVANLQIGFGVRGGGGGGGRGGAAGRGGDSTAVAGAAPPTPPPAAGRGGGLQGTSGNPQPLTTHVAGNLYNDDILLSFAHKYQVNTRWHLERPKLG